MATPIDLQRVVGLMSVVGCSGCTYLDLGHHAGRQQLLLDPDHGMVWPPRVCCLLVPARRPAPPHASLKPSAFTAMWRG